jgi:hypothetical protein
MGACELEIGGGRGCLVDVAALDEGVVIDRKNDRSEE